MEPLLSNVSTKAFTNEPRDLLSRLYREIGISAVAAALEVSDDAIKAHRTPRQKRQNLTPKAA
jgi:hypothetical protein